MKSLNRKRLWIGGGVAALTGVGILVAVFSRGSSRITYQPIQVSRGDVKTTILTTGVVAPANRLDLKPPVAGRVEKVLVHEGQHVKSGQILAWMSSTERAAMIDTARAKGPEEIAYWENSYKMTPILAPGNGLVILKNSDSGQTVTQSDIILAISDRLIVKASVDETDLAQVKEGQKVTVVLDAFPKERMDAKVYHIGFDAKTVSNVTTYEVDIATDEIPDFMKSGMTVNVTFLIAEHPNVLWVPAAAVHREKRKSFVLVPGSSSRAEPTPKEIQVGISDGKRVEITEGLAEGETVLTGVVRGGGGREGRGERQNASPFSPMGGMGGGGRRGGR